MTQAIKADDLGQLIDALLKPSTLSELGLTLGCLGLAWLLVRLLRAGCAESGALVLR